MAFGQVAKLEKFLRNTQLFRALDVLLIEAHLLNWLSPILGHAILIGLPYHILDLLVLILEIEQLLLQIINGAIKIV